MAKAKLKQVKVEIELSLTEHEAIYLKALLQNPRIADEPAEEAEMRAQLFNALKGVFEYARF